MPAYVINDMEVTDPVAFEQYRRLSPPTVAQYGGRFLARGGVTQTLDGAWSPKRLVLLEFPSVERAKAWFDSREYADARALRERSARSNIIVTEGIHGMSSSTHTKRLGFVKKRADMTHEQFTRHWLGVHARLCAQLPNLRRYSVNLVDKSRFPKFDYDGFSELWFDDEKSLWASLESPQGKTLLADLPNFAGTIDPIVSTETPIVWP